VSDETTVISASKPKRVSSETTKDGWIIRCMSAENTVRAQDAELRQERGMIKLLNEQLQNALADAITLRAREKRLTNGASVLAVIVIVLAFILIGGAR
jgi:hypothetical protein